MYRDEAITWSNIDFPSTPGEDDEEEEDEDEDEDEE